MMQRIGLLVLILILGILAPGAHQILAAESEGTVLFVAPSRLTFAPGESISVVDSSNKSKVARRYDLELVDEVMGANGITSRLETFPYSVKRMLKFQPKRFTLQPGETQTVRIMVTRPGTLADGDYHSHLLFREVPLDVKSREQLEAEHKEAEKKQKTASFEIRTMYGVAIPVIVQHGKIIQDISVDESKLVTSADGKGRQLSIDFTRIGNSEASGKLSANYVQAGKEPVPVIETQWIRLYHEVDKVSKSFPLINMPEGAKGGKIVITLMKSETDDSKTVKKEIAFN